MAIGPHKDRNGCVSGCVSVCLCLCVYLSLSNANDDCTSPEAHCTCIIFSLRLPQKDLSVATAPKLRHLVSMVTQPGPQKWQAGLCRRGLWEGPKSSLGRIGSHPELPCVVFIQTAALTYICDLLKSENSKIISDVSL